MQKFTIILLISLAISVNVLSQCVAPSVSSFYNTCANQSAPATLFAETNDPTCTATIVHKWYTSPTGSSYVTPTVQSVGTCAVYHTIVTVTESTTYWVSAVVNGCESPRAKATAVFKKPYQPLLSLLPSTQYSGTTFSGATVPVDGNGSGAVTLLASGGYTGSNPAYPSTYQWYDASSGGNLLFTGPSFNTSLNINTATNGTMTFYVGGTMTDWLGCTYSISPRKAITIKLVDTKTAASNVDTFIPWDNSFTDINNVIVADRTKVARTSDYYDGLGRLKQTVLRGGSPSGNDLISTTTYDGFGNKSKTYSPVSLSGQSDGSYKTGIIDPISGSYIGAAANFYSNTSDNIADDAKPYSQIFYESTPLKRVQKIGNTGADWQPQGPSTLYANLNQSWSYQDFLPFGQNGGGSVTATISSGILTLTFSAGFGLAPLKNGAVKLIPSTPALPDMDLGLISMGNYRVAIKGGYIFITSTQSSAYPYVSGFGNDSGSNTVVFTVNLAPPDHTIKKEYLLSNANEVLNWSYNSTTALVDAGTAAAPIYFSTNSLYVTKTLDEHNNVSYEYKNNENKVLLKRVQSGSNRTPVDDSNYASTYYVYDCHNNLVCVIPPAATALLSTQYFHSTATNSTKESFLKAWSFRYWYDSRQRLIQKQIPGTDPIVLVYDNRNRLVFTQDGIQRPNKYWSFIKYDAVNRPVSTGVYQADVLLQRSDMQQRVDLFYNSVPGNGGAWFETFNGTGIHGYDNKSYPQETIADNFVTITYYDVYGFKSSWTGSYSYTTDSEIVTGAANLNLKGQITGTKVKVLDGAGVRGGSIWLKTINYYDNKYRVVQSIADNYRGGQDITSNLYDFTGKIKKSRLTHSTTIPSNYSITRRFLYDYMGRMTEEWHQLGTGTEYRIAYYQYNELGQLVDKKLHSTASLASDAKQSIDYRYNIRGWLTSINNSQLIDDHATINTNDDNNDLFGTNYLYNSNDNNLGTTSLYNGNVSGSKWSFGNGKGSAKEYGYTFTYDAMNRLVDANSKLNKGGTWQAGFYDEKSLSYDLNGNIKSLTRWMGTSGQIDNLTYEYGSMGNQLVFVQDNASGSTIDKFKGFNDANPGTVADYTYDVNGNLTRDLNKGIGNTLSDPINSIAYNFLNLPELVTKSGNKIRYIYDATGRKLSQIVTTGSTQKRTDYIGDFQYENDMLQFIKHDEGRVLMCSQNLIYSNNFNRTENTTAADVQASNAATTFYNNTTTGESYIKVTSNGIPSGGLIKIGNKDVLNYLVSSGVKYRVRLRGYSGSSAAYLQVTAGGTLLNSPGTLLPNSSTMESWVEQIVTIPNGVTTMTIGVMWGSTVTSGETLYVNDFDVTQLETSAPEYQYYIKDNVGNVRLTFTTKPSPTQTITATFEDALQSTEFNQFLNYPVGGGKINTVKANAHAGNNSHLLNGGNNNKISVAKSYAVMPGDVVSISGYAKYESPTSNDSNPTAFTTALLAAFGAASPVAGEVGTVSTGLNSWGATELAGGGDYIKYSGMPKVFVTIVIFDKNFNVIDFSFDQLKSTGDMSTSYTVKQAGYAYAYVSNEQPTATNVYIDDVAISIAPSMIVSSDDYYPFGLAYNSNSRENTVVQDYKYNKKEIQDELGLGWLDFNARMYMPEIGKWMAVDRLADINYGGSPYGYVNNNPMLYSDPTGMYGVDSNSDIKSTFIDSDGKVVEHRNDGDPLVYFVDDPSSWNGAKDGLGVVGFEDPSKTYRKGDKYDHYYPGKHAQTSQATAWAGALAVSGGLLADDPTVIGVADDILIPFILGGTLIYLATKSDDITAPIAFPLDATSDRDGAIVIFIDGNMSPEAAQHGYDAILGGVINIGTLDRTGAASRRTKNLAASGLPTIPGKDRDEFLPSVLNPSGRVSVRSIDFRDNRSAGGQIRFQLARVKDGATVIVVPINVPSLK